jgi:hypothetical protein
MAESTPVVIPPVRTFKVTRLNPVLQETAALEDILVQAHDWRQDDGVLIFATFVIEDGRPYRYERMAFFMGVVSVEEVKLVSEPASKIIH